MQCPSDWTTVDPKSELVANATNVRLCLRIACTTSCVASFPYPIFPPCIWSAWSCLKASVWCVQKPITSNSENTYELSSLSRLVTFASHNQLWSYQVRDSNQARLLVLQGAFEVWLEEAAPAAQNISCDSNTTTDYTLSVYAACSKVLPIPKSFKTWRRFRVS